MYSAHHNCFTGQFLQQKKNSKIILKIDDERGKVGYR